MRFIFFIQHIYILKHHTLFWDFGKVIAYTFVQWDSLDSSDHVTRIQASLNIDAPYILEDHRIAQGKSFYLKCPHH